MGGERNEFGIPTELVDFNKQKNGEQSTGQSKITTLAIQRIHNTIQNSEDFVLGAGAIPGPIEYINGSNTTNS